MFRAARFRDVHLYGQFASQVFDGRVPYRDFFMEYPPGALAVFLPADVAGVQHYNAAFKSLMALCGVLTLALVAWLLVRLGASRARLWIAVLLLALSPIALGPISLNTYDAWPALLTVGALAALVTGWVVVAFALLGLAFTAKVYPVVLLPVALAFAWRQRVRALAAFTAVSAAVVVPFLVLAPNGLLESFRAQAARALQVESLGASLLATADHLGVYSATVVHRTGHAISYDLVGTLPRALAAASSVVQVSAVLVVTWLYVRGRGDAQRLAVAFAAAVAGFLAFTRFFSPQYMVWLIPFVALLGPVEWALAACAVVLAQTWFFHYDGVRTLSGWTWLVLARNLFVVMLFVVLLRRAAKDEDAVAFEHELPARVPP